MFEIKRYKRLQENKLYGRKAKNLRARRKKDKSGKTFSSSTEKKNVASLCNG